MLAQRVSRDAELAAERSHALAVLQANDKTHPFVHNRTLLPRHGLHPLWGIKCNPCLRNVLLPLSPTGQSTTYSDSGLRFGQFWVIAVPSSGQEKLVGQGRTARYSGL